MKYDKKLSSPIGKAIYKEEKIKVEGDPQNKVLGGLNKVSERLTSEIDSLKKSVEEMGDKITNKVEVVNQKDFPTKLDVNVLNHPDQKDIKFPEVQKVEITNPNKEIEFPDVQKVKVLNPVVPKEIQKVDITNKLPIGNGKDANPSEYIVVRLSDGDHFYKALDTMYVAASKGAESTVGELRNIQANQLNGLSKVQIVSVSGNVASITPHDGLQALVVHTPDMSTSGNISGLNQSVQMDIHGMGSAFVQVGGTWQGKIDIQGAIDSQWNTLSIFQPTGLLIRTGINNDAQNGLYRVVITTGYTKIRAVFTTYSSGSASILMNASTPVGSSQVWQLNGNNLHTLIDNPVLTVSGRQAIIDPSNGNPAAVIAGANTGVKGLRVYGGPTDPISDLPVTIDYDHHQIHEGEAFRYPFYISGVNNGVSKDIRIVVPNISVPAGVATVARMPHFRFELVASNTADFYLYEAPTFTGNGTQRTPVAVERNGTYSPQLQLWEDPTVSVVGTQLFRGVIFASKNSSGSVDTTLDEFILKNNTSYLLRATSSSQGNIFLIRVFWYEDLGV